MTNFVPSTNALDQSKLAPSPLTMRPIVEAALREDIRSGDHTTDALLKPDQPGRASMNMREQGVFCGGEAARLAFATLDADCKFESSVPDGALVAAGDTVFTIAGKGRALLTGERVALNFVQRLSGIATLTHQFVSAIEGTGARITDTRKTTPNLRLLEKYAVQCGGGTNHRFALDDLILIKDNHIALCGGVANAVARARARSGHALKVEVECDSIEQVEEALTSGVDIILLDNMTLDCLREAVARIAGRALVEASGGVNLGTVRAIALTGVDIISVGLLTHGARALDIGLDVEMVPA